MQSYSLQTLTRAPVTYFQFHGTIFFWFSCFSYLCTKIQDSLPPRIVPSQTLSSFTRYLKTHYFQSANLPPFAYPQCAGCALILFWDFGAIPSFFLSYLLVFLNNNVVVHDEVIRTYSTCLLLHSVTFSASPKLISFCHSCICLFICHQRHNKYYSCYTALSLFESTASAAAVLLCFGTKCRVKESDTDSPSTLPKYHTIPWHTMFV